MSLPARLQNSTDQQRRTLVRLLIQRCEYIPTMPWAAEAIVPLARDINSSLDRLEAAIKTDLACTARLLRTANTAFYGSARSMTSVRRAILLLGFRTIERLVSTLPVFDSFRTHNTAEIAHLNGLWFHSVAVATLARRIAADVSQRVDAESAFCAGLLHDLGRITLLQLFPKAYHPLLTRLERNPACNLIKAELETFHVTHMEAGRWLAEAWHFPAPMVRVMALHHALHPTDPLVTTVVLADHLVQQQQLGLESGAGLGVSLTRLLRALNLTPDHMTRYTTYIQAEVQTLHRLVSSHS